VLAVTPAPTAPAEPDAAPADGLAACWPDEAAFLAADPRRASSDEVDLGATWRRPGAEGTWRLAWLADTGELYLCRVAGWPAEGTDVTVLAVVPDERRLDVLLDGWRDRRGDEDGLAWLASRVTPGPRACA
jgi:hypothetical protein